MFEHQEGTVLAVLKPQALNADINAVLAEPEVRKRLVELGGEPLITKPEDFGAMIKAETDKWEKVVKYADIKIE